MKSVPIPPAALLVIAGLLSAAAQAMPGDAGLLPGAIGVTQLHATDARSGLALGGRDPVSYQMDGIARAGRPEHETLWEGAGWRFASAANRVAFLRAPDAFAPRIGGHDAVAAAEGRLVEADPEIFAVRSGRLYLFRTPEARAQFETDPGLAARAEAGWAKLRGSVVRG